MQPFAELSPATLERLERAGLDFLASFYAVALRHRPDQLETLSELAHVLTRLGRFEDGLAIDRRLAERAPEDQTVRYNLACSLALCGDRDGALAELERAVSLGYADPEHLEGDADLASLREDPRFVEILKRIRS